MLAVCSVLHVCFTLFFVHLFLSQLWTALTTLTDTTIVPLSATDHQGMHPGSEEEEKECPPAKMTETVELYNLYFSVYGLAQYISLPTLKLHNW